MSIICLIITNPFTGLLIILSVSLFFSMVYAVAGLLLVRQRGIRFFKLISAGMKGALLSFLILMAILFFARMAGSREGQPLFRLSDNQTLICFLIFQLLYVAAFLYRIRSIQRKKAARRNNPGS